MRPLHMLGRATRLWWYDWTSILFLNTVWLLLQLPLVTGPPATAALYAMMRESSDGQYWGPRDAWQAFRGLFWPAWRWGLLNLLAFGLGAFNLLFYADRAGTMWFVLRLAWIGALTVWTAVNLFYWPFWLEQEKKSVRTALANSGRFLLLHPLTAVVLVFVCGLLLAVSTLTVVPLVLGAVCWVALVGVLAVRQSLALHASQAQVE